MAAGGGGEKEIGRNLGRWFLPHTRLELIVRRTALRLASLPLVDHYLAKVTTGRPSHVIAEQPQTP